MDNLYPNASARSQTHAPPPDLPLSPQCSSLQLENWERLGSSFPFVLTPTLSSAPDLSSVARVALLSLALRVTVLLWAALTLPLGFLGDSDSKASAYNAGDPGSIPGLGRSSGEGNGNPL